MVSSKALKENEERNKKHLVNFLDNEKDMFSYDAMLYLYYLNVQPQFSNVHNLKYAKHISIACPPLFNIMR